jgi:hypothetical protein
MRHHVIINASGTTELMKHPNLPKIYAGLNNDVNGGMTMIGNIIRDAWVFGILPETETCEGWEISRIDVIHQQVNTEWDKYGCLVSGLPEDLRERHKRIYSEAITLAKKKGWDPEAATRDEN